MVKVVKDVLKSVGLTQKETEVYLMLLSQGELTVNEISKNGGIHRQVCYDVLERLMEKGFVSCFTAKKKKYYKPLNPHKILDYLEGKRQAVSEILPTLLEMTQSEKTKAEIELVKGNEVLRIIYSDIYQELKNKKEHLRVMGVEENEFLQYDRIAIKQHITRFRENKMKEKIISSEAAKTFFPGPQSEYRLLPAEMFNSNPIHIYGNKVAMIIWGVPMYGIIINNKEMAKANKSYFDILWKIAKKKK